MELRVLRYFLMVAREENITRAAQLLHITQPTLSRQLMQLEEELGVQLFRRGKYSVSLTEEGMLLRRRAQELVSLSDKTVAELASRDEIPAGEISIGCGETSNMEFLSDCIVSFREKYPSVQFDIYSAIADDIKERIEKGTVDMGMLVEPVNIGRYEFLRLPYKEKWGVFVRKDSVLAGKDAVTPQDLAEAPIIMSKREAVKNEIASWFGDYYDGLNIAATYNLGINAVMMVRQGVGAALTFDLGVSYDNLRFIPLSPTRETGAVMVWKKNQVMPEAAKLFIEHVRNAP